MIEEFEEPKKLGLAAAIAREALTSSSWAIKNDVPKTTAYRWAQEPKVQDRRLDDSPPDARSRGGLAMTMRSVFAAPGFTRLASDAESETVQLNAVKTILTDAMRIARYTDLETRMAEFEEKLRLVPSAFRRCRGRGPFCHGEELAKSAENLSTFSRFFPTGRSRDGAQAK